MDKFAIISCAVACGAVAACNDSGFGNSRNSPTTYPATQAYPAGGQTHSTASGNSMPGASGGFNNDEVNGKSRNPYSTTPGTGPMNSNPVASGNTPR